MNYKKTKICKPLFTILVACSLLLILALPSTIYATGRTDEPQTSAPPVIEDKIEEIIGELKLSDTAESNMATHEQDCTDSEEAGGTSADLTIVDTSSNTNTLIDQTPRAEIEGSSTTENKVLEISEDQTDEIQMKFTNVIKNNRTGNEYTTLADAINEANESDVLELLTDLTLTQQVTFPADKHLTFDLGTHTITSEIDEANNHAINISSGGSLVIRNGILTAKDVNTDDKTGGAIKLSTIQPVILTIEDLEIYNFHSTAKGSALSVTDSSHKVTIDRGHFHDNSAVVRGGAISFDADDTKGVNSMLEIKNTTIANNSVTGDERVDGGGVCYVGPGSFTLINSVICENKATSTADFYGFKNSNGGGLSINGAWDGNASLKVHLAGNIISSNSTQLYGGGIFFNLSKFKNDTLELVSGTFDSNHSDYAGGAIDYSKHKQPPLRLKNVVITNNKAVTGGGIWLCPTGSLETHSTIGGVIIGNLLYKNNPQSAGTDIQFEGSDSSFKTSGNDPDINRVTVSPRTFTGELVDWYADEKGNLYQPGNLPVSSDYYTSRSTTFGLYGKLEDGVFDNALKQAALVFTNNTAIFRGGAISSNSPLIIGEPTDKKVSVTKIWTDKNGEEKTEDLPVSIEVTLVRKGDDGSSLELEKVILSAENNWTYSFENLPAYGLIGGNKVNFTYKIIEKEVPAGYEVNEEYVDEGILRKITIDNREKNQEPTETSPSEPKPTETKATEIRQTQNPPTAPTVSQPILSLPKTGENRNFRIISSCLLISTLGLCIITRLLLLKKK